jgi:hypothetical protein
MQSAGMVHSLPGGGLLAFTSVEHRPARHTAFSAEAGRDGSHLTPRQLGMAQSMTAQRRCSRSSVARDSACAAGQQPPQQPLKEVMTHSESLLQEPSGASTTGRAGARTHWPCSQRATKSFGFTEGQAIFLVHCSPLQSILDTAQRCCSRLSSAVGIARSGGQQPPPQQPAKVVRVHSASALHCASGRGRGTSAPATPATTSPANARARIGQLFASERSTYCKMPPCR